MIGFTCAGIQIAALPSIAATYAIDSYKPASGAIFVSITANKNLWGYGVSQFITRWVKKGGYVPPFMTNMCLTVLWCSCGVIFWIWGKHFRRWTAKSSVHQRWKQLSSLSQMPICYLNDAGWSAACCGASAAYLRY